jgi:hypothetical protein
MIKESTKKTKTTVTKTELVEKEVVTYTCSDGKVFTNEADMYNRQTGKQLAEEHENRIQNINKAKEELRFISINSSSNEGYEYEFCFHYKKDLSKFAKEELLKLVYELTYDKLEKMQEGWWHVDQYVYEVSSCGRNCEYSCDGDVTYLQDLINEKESELTKLKNIFNK